PHARKRLSSDLLFWLRPTVLPHGRRTAYYVKNWRRGQASSTGDQGATARRLHRPRARARPPRPPRPARRGDRHLDPDADLPLRHPRRAAPRDPPPGPPTPARGLHRPPPRPSRRALPHHPEQRLVGDDRSGRPALPA